MTQLIQNEMKELLREDLKNNPQDFWKDLFCAVDHYIGVYIDQLEKQGVDLDYLEYKIEKSINLSSLEGITLKEKLGSIILPLEKVMTELHITYSHEKKRKSSLEKLKKEIKEKEDDIKKLQMEKENLEAISKATESELAIVRDQTLYELEEEMKDIRSFLMHLPEDIKTIENNGNLLPDKFKKRLHKGIQEAYTILQEAKLWQYDAKPENVTFNKVERPARRDKNKKYDENELAILEINQEEDHTPIQLSEEKINHANTSEENSTKDLSMTQIEESIPLKEEELANNKQGDEDQN